MLNQAENRKYSTYGDNGCWQYYDDEGQLHRDNDRPAVVCKSGRYEWYHHGERHRDIGPAIIDKQHDCMSWWKHGFREVLNNKGGRINQC